MFKILEYDIILNEICHDLCPPEWSWTSINNNWNGFHLWYIIKNNVEIRVGKNHYMLYPGDVFLFDLTQNHICTHDPEYPVEMYTVHFQCVQEKLIQQQIKEGVIANKQHPIDTQMNLSLLAHLCSTKDVTTQNIWIGPVLQQILDITVMPDVKAQVVEFLCQQIQESLYLPFSLKCLSQQSGYSINHIVRVFRRATGNTPYNYYLALKIDTAKRYLIFSDLSVKQIADILQYHDVSHFTAQFRQKTGMTPQQFINMNKNREGI